MTIAKLAAVYREPDSQTSMRADHRTALNHVAEEAARLAAAATRIVQMCEQVVATGGQLAIEPQINFITGTHARLVKDWGVCQHLQGRGMALRPRMRS